MKYFPISVILLWVLWMGFSSNPPQSRTGAPGEGTCNASGCHNSSNPAIQGDVFLDGISEGIKEGESYTLTLRLQPSLGSPKRAGFQMTILDRKDQAIGSLSSPGPNTTVTEADNRFYFEHNPASNFIGTQALEFNVNWNLPEAFESDSIYFYAAANFANGDGGTTGDRIVTFKKSFAVNRVSTLKVLATLTPLTCPDATNASIKLQITGGQSPYKVLWNTGDTSAQIANLGPGDYKYTVTDDLGAMVTETLGITQENVDRIPPVFNCFKDTFFIATCVPFIYTIPTASDNCELKNVRLAEGIGSNMSFPVGTTVDVYEAIDDSGNKSICTVVVVNKPTNQAKLEIFQPKCATDSLGSVLVSVNGANIPVIIKKDDQFFSKDSLPSGQYLLSYHENNGCQTVQAIEIKRPKAIKLDSLVIKHARTNNSGDGAISIAVSGGTGSYKFKWFTENDIFADTKNLSSLFAGKYILHIEDTNGCKLVSDSIKVDFITSNRDLALDEALNIYPSIAEDFVSVHFKSSLWNKLKLSLFDSNGTIHLEHAITSHEILKLDLSQFKSGIYFIRISGNNSVWTTRKIIKL